MPMKLLSADDFRAQAKDGQRPDGTVFRFATAEPTQVGEETARTQRFVFSDATVDHAGDSIDPKGWDLDVFAKNPVALFAHMSWDPPIGRASNVAVLGGQLVGDIEFAEADVYDFADTIYRLVKGKFLKAVSVGFIPKDWAFSSDKDRPYGIDFKKQALLEISVCPVPCNPNALGAARAIGVDTRPLAEWAEKVLDNGDTVFLPRGELETLRLQAKEAKTMRTKAEDWTCGAARDLPLDKDGAWDGPAAEAAIFAHAGGDDFNPTIARQAFLAYDASAPKLRGSYKLPFADVIDGKLTARASGIRAAASRLPQTDIPDAVKTTARAVLDYYEAMMDGKAAGEGSGSAGGDLVAAPLGSCGRAKDMECGMKDAQECAVHYTPPTKAVKSGRRISAATRAQLETAMDHHSAMGKCIKAVMDGDGDDDQDDPNGQPTPTAEPAGSDELEEMTPEQRRLKEATAIKTALKTDD